MSAYKDRERGTFILDRSIRGVGRIKLASGTSHLATFNRLNEMIEGLKERGRLDLLRAIKARVLTPLQVWDAYRINRLDSLPSPETLVPLFPTFEKWTTTHKASTKHRRSLQESLGHLRQHGRASSTLSELPAVLKATRAALERDDKAQTFRLAKAACQAFLKVTVGRVHALYAEVSGVEPIAITPKQHKRPQSVGELDAVTAQMDPQVSACLWSMATTGMGQAEYWGVWERRTDRDAPRIHIAGTKRKARDRDIPDLGIAVPPPITREAFRHRADKMRLPFSPYDMRRTFANWMESAGILRTRRIVYLGHAAGDVTSLYEFHDVRRFIAEDGTRLLAYMESERAKAKKATEVPVIPIDRERQA